MKNLCRLCLSYNIINMDSSELRLKQAYEHRKQIPKNRYSVFNNANLYMAQKRECRLVSLLNKTGRTDLKNYKIADIGCGTGSQLLDFLRYGAVSENLYGIDLLEERISRAKNVLPNSDIRLGNATELPWRDNEFDIAIQSTVFTSILEADIRRKVASEILRVLKSGGILLWYDFHFNNPSNPDVKAVNSHEIQALFPNCHVHLEKTTLAPPLTRAIAPISTICCELLEKLRFLNTHYLGYIQKP